MIKVIHTRCQPWLYKNAKCRLCADACPIENCIGFKENTVSVDKALCIGCGICTNACPTSALVFENLSDKELLQRLETRIAADDKDVVFGCSLGQKQQSTIPEIASVSPRNGVPKKSQIFWGENDITPNSELFINLPCLAILKESHLVSIILSGAKNIYLDTMGCNYCSFKHGKRVIEQSISYANNLLKAAGYEDCIKAVVSEKRKTILSLSKNKKKNIKTITPFLEYSRRELLHFFREKAVERIVGENEKKGGDKGIEEFPERRHILIETFKRVGNNLQTAKIGDGSFPVNQLMIDENCTLCHDCSLFCPTGALTRVEGDGKIRIDFNMSLCMRCYECKELCPEDSISKQGSIDINQMFNAEVETIFKRETKVCPSCGKTFFAEHGIGECLICRKKNNMDEIFFSALFKNPDMQENKQTIGGER